MTAFDSVKLNEQQEAVLAAFKYFGDEWLTSYQLVGFKIDGVTIGDAGRRMRELREAGILESRKRGRYEEYRLKPLDQVSIVSVWDSEAVKESATVDSITTSTHGPTTRTVHSRDEAYDLVDKGWTIIKRDNPNGQFTAVLRYPQDKHEGNGIVNL